MINIPKDPFFIYLVLHAVFITVYTLLKLPKTTYPQKFDWIGSQNNFSHAKMLFCISRSKGRVSEVRAHHPIC